MLDKIFPIIIIILMFFASIVCAFKQQWGSVIYWMSGSLINVAATFLMKRFG